MNMAAQLVTEHPQAAEIGASATAPARDEIAASTSGTPRPASKPTVLDAIRAFGVMSGGPLLLDLFAAGSVVAMTRGFLLKPRTGVMRLARWTVALGVVAPVAYFLGVRPWHRRWGATDEELRKPLPGDELQPDPGVDSTRAITIDAPVEEVWPWLAQIGQDRGGFYSYELLENLAGCRLENADRIHPEWQQREVGETMYLHPASGLKVTIFEPNHALGIQGWGTYVLEPLDDGRTRLIARGRTARGMAALLYVLFIEIPHFIMERKMLLEIKERAERVGHKPAA
jgi:hypothetical protein